MSLDCPAVAVLSAAWLLAVALLATSTAGQPILGDIIVYTENYTAQPYPTLPADFGPDVPEDGVDGLLLLADPPDACAPFTFVEFTTPWVALIARAQRPTVTNCTFDIKVQHAQQAGASAAIVYDDVYEALIIMSKPLADPDPSIPAVFVSQKAGQLFVQLLVPGVTRVRILPVSALAWVSMVMSAFLGFLALTVVVGTFLVMRSWNTWISRARLAAGGNRARLPAELGYMLLHGDEGLPPSLIRSLPVLVHEGDGGRRSRTSAGSASGLEAADPEAPGGGLGRVAAGQTQAVAVPGVVAQGGDRGTDGCEVDAEVAAAGQSEGSCAPPGGPAGVPASAPAVLASCGGAWSPSSSSSDDSASDAASDAGGAGGAAACALAAPAPRPPRPTPGSRGGATRRTCVVCLERYAAGEKVRVLPCQHRFHVSCIDPWLGARRFCPVCKHDASQPAAAPPAAARAGGSGGGGGDAPLLAHGGEGGTPSVSALGAAALMFGGFGRRGWLRRLQARMLQQRGADGTAAGDPLAAAEAGEADGGGGTVPAAAAAAAQGAPPLRDRRAVSLESPPSLPALARHSGAGLPPVPQRAASTPSHAHLPAAPDAPPV